MDFVMFIDADSVPQNLRSIILRAAVRTGAAAFFVSDRILKDVEEFISEDTHNKRVQAKSEAEGMYSDDELKTVLKRVKSRISSVVVPVGANSADDYIAEKAALRVRSDPGAAVLCITHDIPLASRLLEAGCTVIDDRGGEYTEDTIKTRLMARSVNAELRSWGVFADVQKKRKQSDVKAFSDMLDKVITRILRD